jgi:hypothetical protein
MRPWQDQPGLELSDTATYLRKKPCRLTFNCNRKLFLMKKNMINLHRHDYRINWSFIVQSHRHTARE